jgi:predicted dehydrogenase
MARIGIIGTGWGARSQVPNFREAGLEVVAIAGSHRNKTKRVAEELGLEAVDEWRELVTRGDIDLVTIVTPPSEHLAMATAALDAGKHVICEKPTALDASEAERLVEVGKRNPGRVAIIDHELRFLPSFRAARERIAELGGIRYAEARYASPARGDRSREWNWWSDAGRGGGVWGAVGSHFVDTLRYFGLEVEAAQATLATFIDERPFGDGTRKVTADDFAAVTLRLRDGIPLLGARGGAPGTSAGGERNDESAGRAAARPYKGALAAMTFSGVASGPDEPSVLTIHGENGAMRLVSEELQMALRGEPFSRAAGGPTAQRAGNSFGGAFGTGTFYLGRALRAALDDGSPSALAPAASLEDGLAQQRVLDAARRSSAGGGRWEPV